MQVLVCTIFPDLFKSFFSESLVGKAVDKKLLNYSLLNIRDFSKDKHLKVDDIPYGGGAGMVMTPQPVHDALSAAHKVFGRGHVIYMSPQGKTFSQQHVKRLYNLDKPLIFLCGRYEGVDERIIENYVDEELSIGDFVLNGGEIAAMVVIEALSRLIPGMLGNSNSLDEESHSDGLLEYPQYTRPQSFNGFEVPDILLSGHHENIRKWRHLKSLERTKSKRPDLFSSYPLSPEEKESMKGRD